MAQQAESDDPGCYPYDRIKEVHDKVRDGSEPEKPTYTSEEKLMKPQDGKDLEY